MVLQEVSEARQQNLLPKRFRHVDTDGSGEIAVLLACRALKNAVLRLSAPLVPVTLSWPRQIMAVTVRAGALSWL
ncbi:hypothetical protein N181_20035 [Sinorhizobium fredii USDA 205]|nr:hypothetical protein N181_20035 [Sinorhizobium fredii USDA 205]GEC32323.1 hypothetical protein EFR01_24940 [Sinorhizobium fredii]GLS06851.1 hypothetical protein GCM10007864_04770 [Sinorhizobium fredii]